MDRVCPRCRGTTPESLCPRCGVQTASGAAKANAPPEIEGLAPTGGWLLGLLLAQGLYYGLWHLANAWLIARGGDLPRNEFWEDSFAGLVTTQALQGVALFIGATLAAAGRRRGLWIGATLGLVNAAILLLLPVLTHRNSSDLIWYIQPVFHLFIGALGGAVGSRVWQPAPSLPPLAGDGRTGREMLTTILPDRPVEVVVEPFPWLLVFAGILVAVGGTLGARFIREFVVVAGGGKGREMEQSLFFTWEITFIAQVIGGAMPGAGTRRGALYGFWVGLSAALILVVIQASATVRVAAPIVPTWLIGSAVTEGSFAVLVTQAAQVLLLGPLGGWLGGLILPADPGQRPTLNR